MHTIIHVFTCDAKDCHRSYVSNNIRTQYAAEEAEQAGWYGGFRGPHYCEEHTEEYVG